MSDEAGMQFSNRVGQELFQLLRQRVSEQLAGEQNFDSYTPALGAALIAGAEVLRDPVEKGGDPEKLVAFASRWLRTFLDQIGSERPT
jgi:hypothetical protein